MNFDEYLVHFGDILAQPEKHAPYDNEEYLQYAKMNWTRMSRWTKRFEPNEAMKRYVDSITEEQHWIVITEPWCGDAAHSVPQIYQMVKNNPNIDFDIQLRDSEPHLIDDYLTNGGKSIPKLIIRNDVGHDKAVWGPRPAPLQAIFEAMKADNQPFEEIKEALQKWYNEDKGVAIQQELLALLA
ncbi:MULTISPECIES: thioredoxin family protein [Sphingobacterium]|uniref:Thioredoxin family protein n=1 Tax=Sphingobacterium populi TaxID=1812824 RepID=A0ABW5UBX1_9SPHI|nr:thioredoxin family protein [Sphingobacterium sp. CFCC 11742]